MSAGLRACLAISAELRAAAVDALSNLPMIDRRALAIVASYEIRWTTSDPAESGGPWSGSADLVSEVGARASLRAGVKVDGTSAAAAVAEALAALDAAYRQSG